MVEGGEWLKKGMVEGGNGEAKEWLRLGNG
jgi:hypothetical protein